MHKNNFKKKIKHIMGKQSKTFNKTGRLQRIKNQCSSQNLKLQPKNRMAERKIDSTEVEISSTNTMYQNMLNLIPYR